MAGWLPHWGVLNGRERYRGGRPRMRPQAPPYAAIEVPESLPRIAIAEVVGPASQVTIQP